MKLIFALAALLSFASLAQAGVCTVDMTDGYRTLRTYRGSGYDRTDACREALRDCNRDRISRPGQGRLQCETRSYTPGNPYPNPNPGYESCTFQLKDRFGYNLRSFTATSYYRSQACSDASRQCDSERNYRASRGEYGLSCMEDYFGGGNPPPSQTTASCSAELVDRYGYRLSIITESAYGRSYSEAHGQACAEALKSCRARAGYNQSCRSLR